MSRVAQALAGLALASALVACGVPPQRAAPPPSPTAVPTAPAAPPPSPNPTPTVEKTLQTPSRPASASAQPATRKPALPKELVIPAIHVDAPVEHVGTTSDGAMDAPHEWNDVAWFDQGFRPGEPGSAVIAGHLDSTTDRAVFWDLRLLKAGDTVQVKDDDGSQLTFQVQDSEIYAFNQAPLQKIFGGGTQAMLNLVTCNGVFDRGAKNYDKRLVVYAKEIAG
jgi:sortase A